LSISIKSVRAVAKPNITMRKSREEFFRWFLNLGFLGMHQNPKIESSRKSNSFSLSLQKHTRNDGIEMNSPKLMLLLWIMRPKSFGKRRHTGYVQIESFTPQPLAGLIMLWNEPIT
jgi:hypothetical protein